MRPAPKNDLTAKLIASFKRMISEGALVAGDKLPPERELAKEFRVSGSSLRQALKVLETMGILSQRVGDGTYFSAEPSSILGEPMDFLSLLGAISKDEIFEARLLVERGWRHERRSVPRPRMFPIFVESWRPWETARPIHSNSWSKMSLFMI